MARYVSRTRIREGRGSGEKVTEFIVTLGIVAAILWGLRWYFVVYRQSPGYALQGFVGALKAGDTDSQFKLLAESTKKVYYPTKSAYTKGFKPSQGFQGRMTDFTLGIPVVKGDAAECDVTLGVRKANQDILQTSGENFKDHYILIKEKDGWKVALDKSTLTSTKSISQY